MASIRTGLATLGAAGLVLWLGTPGGAYSLGGQRWTSDIVMHLQLGSPSGTLIDGNTSWNQVAENALAIWNPFLRDVSFGVVRESTAGMARSNNVNNVFFADDAYGDPFGTSVLAVTLGTYRVSDSSYNRDGCHLQPRQELEFVSRQPAKRVRRGSALRPPARGAAQVRARPWTRSSQPERPVGQRNHEQHGRQPRQPDE